MSTYSLNTQDTTDAINTATALNASRDILRKSPSAAIFRGVKDIATGKQPVPRSLGEGLQFFSQEIFGKPKDKFYYRSQYGTPVYNYFIIKGEEATQTQGFTQLSTLSSYRVKYTNDGGFNPNTWDELSVDGTTTGTATFPAIFMDSALMTVSKSKEIVKTKIVNNAATRKEYISSSDYDVTITGAFTTGDPSIYPQSDVDALIRALEAPIPLTIVSPYLFRFGITKLVIENFSFPQERGSYASQKFKIKACSHAASWAEIGHELANNTQARTGLQGGIQTGLDGLSNLYKTVNDEIDTFVQENPVL